MALQTTHVWMVFTMEDGDILNCRKLTTNKDSALDEIAGIAENDNALWYKLVHYEANGVFRPGQVGHVVMEVHEDWSLDIIGMYDQYEMIPNQIRQNDDYWIDDIDIT